MKIFKHLFSFLVLVIGFHTAHAQYANSWINYSQQYYKIKIATNGVYRIDAATLQATGIPTSSVNGNTYQLFNRGASVPVYASSTNPFGSSDYLEFYAVKNDGGTEATLYNTPLDQSNDKLSLFTDTAAYFLTWSSAPNPDIIVNYNNVITNPPAAENYCLFTSTNVYGGARQNAQYIHGKPEIQGQSLWDSDFSHAEGYIDNTFNHSANNKTVSTPHVYGSGPASQLKTQWNGKFPTDHFMEVSVGGSLITTRSYFGFNVQRLDTLLPTNALLSSPTTTVTFSSLNNPTTAVDHNGISFIELTYPRQLNADNTSSFAFKLPAAAGQRYLTITNFNSQSTQPVLYDLTNKLRLVSVAGGLDTLKYLLPAASGERTLVMVANTIPAISTVSTIKPLTFTNFSQPSNQGDFIIISHPYFYNDGTGNNFVDEYKQMKNNHGFQSVVVDINELYDQFAWGVDLSPLSIRNFTDYVLGNWNGITGQKYMLLIGKGTEFYAYHINPSLKQYCYVPTWGNPGSDLLLTATPSLAVPRIPIGRLSIMTHQELKNYKDKVDEFITAQQQPQTIENKAWMKNVVHLSGGENENDQYLFQYILNTYATQVEDSVYFGGNATLFSKNSTDPISTAASAEMDSLISNGVSLITFFGHSSFQSLDFNLNDPYNYHNDNGKYPLILTNGCLVGNLFSTDNGLGGSFMYAQSRGSIGFLAPSSFSVSNSLQLYTDNFYRNYTNEHYNEPIGVVIQKTTEDAVNYSGNNVDRAVAEQMLFTGDPSLYLNTFEEPDYAIEDPSVYINPSVVTAGVDTFTVNIVVTNIGKSINDSIYVDITRIFPDGQQSLVVHDLIKAPYFIDTFTYKMANNTLTDLGLNQFNIKIDAESDVDELSETNNEITHSLFIQSDDILPVYPYEYAIVNSQNVELKASTVNPFVQQGHYVFQLDTTELFNSPFLKTTNITQDGGVVKWTPVLTMTDSTVYYWRTSVDTIGGKQYSWHGSSFTYLPNVGTGWSQSHYYQYLHDGFTNVELDDNRHFNFVDDVKNIAVYNGVASDYGGPLNWDQIGYFINNVKMAKWTCGGSVNWMFAVIDSATGIQWLSTDSDANGLGQYNNIHCWSYDLNAFYFNSTDPNNFQKIIDFIDTIPTGNYVLAVSINNPAYAGFTPELEAAFQSIGATGLDTLTEIKPYVLFSKKGDPTYPIYEIVGDSITSIIDTSFNITGSWSTGYIVSDEVGPAASWQSLHWKISDVETQDEVRMQVIGVKNDGTQSVLVQNVLASDTSLGGIDATVYPYLKFRIDYTDTLNRTPPQLEYLRIYYQLQPELAIDPHLFYSISDTVNKYSYLTMDYAVTNVSPIPMYNVPVKYTITDVANVPHLVTNILDTVPANDTVHAHISYQLTTNAFSGVNKIVVEINPFGATHQPEQYHFNNYAATTFIGTQDNVNPYMDVTFDGQHILDGDIVSAKPEINIRLKDDNGNLKLNDTSAFDIKLQWPDGSIHNMPFDNITAFFSPATGTNNTAFATLKPELTMDGRYELIAQGYDKSGNPAGQYAYRVGFDIINKPMISNVLNYPNPFTTQTRFVFTLTGSKVPEFFKIQIMTITGKVVKEIYKAELGNMHIGNNITDYAWDGTDQYGDKLANGLYLYRVVTKLDNNVIDRYETSVDRMFEKGFGKMYLMR